MAINPVLYKKLNYNPVKDFVPISLYVKSPFILVVNPDLPIKSVPDLIKFAKESKTPLTYSSPGAGIALHLSVEYMKQRYGLDITHVPYKSSPQSVADIAAGHVASRFCRSRRLAAADPRRQAARARGLGSQARLPSLPDVPTFCGGRQRTGFRGGVVARAARARRHTEGDRRSSACRDEEDHGRSGDEQAHRAISG